MSECDRNEADQNLDKVLQGLGDIVHVPPEVILAYADGRLTQSACELVSRHLEKCDVCRHTLRLARESLQLTSEACPERDPKDITPMSGRLTAKLALSTYLSNTHDKVVERITRMLVPKSLWVGIGPTMKVLKCKSDAVAVSEEDEAPFLLSAAAFAGDPESPTKELFRVVRRVSQFIRLVNEELLGRCNMISDIPSQISECVESATGSLGDVVFDESFRQRIVSIVVSEVLENE